MRVILLTLSSLLLVASGCAAMEAEAQARYNASLVRKIAFDRPGCAAQKMRVVRKSPDERTVEVDACGALVRYQNVTPHEAFGEHPASLTGGPPTWMDVTPATGLAPPAQAASPPGGP
jgi:hypothetical protein